MGTATLRSVIRACVPVTTILVLMAEPAGAQTSPDPRYADLESRMAAIESQLQAVRKEAMEAASGSGVKKAVEEAVAEAKKKSGSAGYSNGFFIADGANQFQLRLNGLLQTRYIANSNDDTTNDQDETGFQIRRAELYLTGNAFDQKVFFQFAGGFQNASTSGGTFSVVSAYAGYQFTKQFDLRGGIFKAPFMVEEITAASRLPAIERSFLNAYFSAGTTDGMMGQYVSDRFRIAGMVHDGTNAADSEFNGDRVSVGLATRAEFLIGEGDWKQFQDFHGWDTSKPAARLGVAVDYEAGESGDSANLPDQLKWTVDLTAKRANAYLYLAAAGRNQEQVNQYGALAQAGVFVVPNRVELYGRVEHIYLDGYYNATTTPPDESVNLFTLGGNYFFLAHNAKISTDVTYVADELPADITGAGLLTSRGGGPQFVFRVQFQLYF